MGFKLGDVVIINRVVRKGTKGIVIDADCGTCLVASNEHRRGHDGNNGNDYSGILNKLGMSSTSCWWYFNHELENANSNKF